MFELINWYSASWGLLICAITEMLVVMHAYGWRNVLDNIKEMDINIPKVLKYYWISMWTVITPICLTFVLIMTFVQYSPAYSPSYTTARYYFPAGIQALGWMMAFLPVLAIIIGWVYQVWHRKKNSETSRFESNVVT